ncbi:MAG: CvpA family protein [Oscillospiraceae bacterium]|nr:CvpA family protein [Oscillospiraceae bacterium]
MPKDFIIPMYDMIAVAIIIAVGFYNARKGMARAVLDFAAYIVSIMAAFVFSKMGAVFIYEVMIKKNMVAIAEETLNKAGADKAEQILSQLPSFLGKLTDFEGTQLDVQKFAGLNVAEMAQALETGVIAPAVMLLLQIILMIISFSVIFFLARKVSKMLSRIFELPLVGTINHMAGFLLGIVEALIILYIVITVLKLITALAGGFPPYLTRQTLDSTLAARLMGVVGELFTDLVLNNVM